MVDCVEDRRMVVMTPQGFRMEAVQREYLAALVREVTSRGLLAGAGWVPRVPAASQSVQGFR